MALRNSYILTNSLRNLNSLSSIVCRSSVATSRQLSCLVRPEVQKCVDRDLGPLRSRDNENVQYRISIPWIIQIRHYAKSKNKPKRGGNKHKPEHEIDLDESTINEIVDINKYHEDLHKVLEDLKQQYIHSLSLRTNVGTFDRLQVKSEDGTFPLNQIASITQKNPTLIVLNLSQSIKYVPDVMVAINNSGMNLNPQQEGPSTIYVTLPKVSREHREELAKNAKTLYNQSKDHMNRLFTESMRKVNKEKSVDIRKSIENQLLQDKRRMQEEGETLMKAKQKELLGS
ncbi:ribosome-recycling factor, mitochondrial-like [Mercenaria mercenaria]|uniref:ribosome-recycling factor, mitochondrial-like n=1 Tax=Mercenaria mercenaria TaxID=6596 RepID=UPI00234E54FD|nr:ribosome-recycling factor, mitochondrial-like [Mercenaria mercenaria]XP_045192020.2 ribosome-recycling factor, mitochondrial-like [Mercenaria mercenaria]